MSVQESSPCLPTWRDTCWSTPVSGPSNATSASRPLSRNRPLKHTWSSTCRSSLSNARWVSRLHFYIKSELGPVVMEPGWSTDCCALVISGVRKVVQQNVQPPRSHASPCRQQTLQVPLLHQQVQPEGQPQPTHEGQTWHHGRLNRWARWVVSSTALTDTQIWSRYNSLMLISYA